MNPVEGWFLAGSIGLGLNLCLCIIWLLMCRTNPEW